MAKVLLLFAHPALEKSRVHARLIRGVKKIPNLTFHDLYEAYPDFDIDVRKEQQLLLDHDIIVMQHPFYWYSSPALLKQWQDLVLEHNWAYGSEGDKLKGKTLLNVISCGGGKEAYNPSGRNRFTIRQFLAPFDQTAVLCRMRYWPPYVIHSTHQLKVPQIEALALHYLDFLFTLQDDGVSKENWEKSDYLNELLINAN